MPLDSRRPSHFLLRFFFSAGDALSAPAPSQTRPSAVVAAINPVEEADIDRTNGGDIDTPVVGGAAAMAKHKYLSDCLKQHSWNVRTNIEARQNAPLLEVKV